MASRDPTDRFVQRPPPNAAPQRHSRGVRLADQDEPHVIRHAERYKHLKCRYFTLSLSKDTYVLTKNTLDALRPNSSKTNHHRHFLN